MSHESRILFCKQTDHEDGTATEFFICVKPGYNLHMTVCFVVQELGPYPLDPGPPPVLASVEYALPSDGHQLRSLADAMHAVAGFNQIRCL